MKNLSLAFALVAILGGAVSNTSFAAPKAAATLKCPVCGMPMTSAKTASTTVPVYAKAAKKTYYCCPACKAGKAASAYLKKNKKPMPV